MRSGYCDHRELQPRPECQGVLLRQRMPWRGTSPVVTSPYVCGGRRCRKHHRLPRELSSARVGTANLSVADGEVRGARRRQGEVAKAPSFLFPNAWQAQRHGWLSHAPPQLALVHLLGAIFHNEPSFECMYFC